jgi:hypothetical protein
MVEGHPGRRVFGEAVGVAAENGRELMTPDDDRLRLARA